MSVTVANKLPTASEPSCKITKIAEGPIKPCPFCGNKEPELTRESQGMHFDLGTGYIVRCNFLKGGCGARGGSRNTGEEAIIAWNARKK